MRGFMRSFYQVCLGMQAEGIPNPEPRISATCFRRPAGRSLFWQSGIDGSAGSNGSTLATNCANRLPQQGNRAILPAAQFAFLPAGIRP
jgi:hypothetical protein